MLLRTLRCFKVHRLHPDAYIARQVLEHKPLPRLPRAPVVLQGMDRDCREGTSIAGVGQEEVSVQQLWNASRVARQIAEVRRTQGTCVVGGAKAIRRIWRQYKIRPTVVYIPNTEEVPEWCLEKELPTYLVRASPVEVKRHLLSAEYSDGYAAEFPVAPHHVRPAVNLISPASGGKGGEGSPTETREEKAVARPTLALVGLRIPSNVGQLVWTAVENGFQRIVLVNCVDALNEKVLRASQGTVFDPTVEIYEHQVEQHSCLPLLCEIASQHRLLPVLTIPSQDATPAFEVAKRFHRHNRRLQKGQGECIGPLLVLGSEARGLSDLEGEWTVPYLTTSLPLPNALIDSYNVGVAGSVLLHLFRPSALSHFEKVDEYCGEEEGGLLDTASSPPPLELENDDEEGESHNE